MPWTRRDLFQISLLLLCVPAQYFISTQWGSGSVGDRDEFLQRTLAVTRKMLDNYLSLEFWHSRLQQAYRAFDRQWTRRRDRPAVTTGESPAIEVMEYREKEGYFGSSTEVRFPRSDEVTFRIGQVVRHKSLGYRGVVIGWDPVAKAPKNWLKLMHPSNKQHWQYMTNYVVLVDVRDRKEPQTTYVPNENLESVTNVQVLHPDLKEYFLAHTADGYVAQRWLRERYPAD